MSQEERCLQRESLDAAWSQLCRDERAVLVAVAERLVMGRGAYGELDLGRDRRDMQREASEELLDATVYLTCRSLQRARLERP